MRTYLPGEYVTLRDRIGRIVGDPIRGNGLVTHRVQFNRGEPEIVMASLLDPVEIVPASKLPPNVVPIRPDVLVNATGWVC